MQTRGEKKTMHNKGERNTQAAVRSDYSSTLRSFPRCGQSLACVHHVSSLRLVLGWRALLRFRWFLRLAFRRRSLALLETRNQLVPLTSGFQPARAQLLAQLVHFQNSPIRV